MILNIILVLVSFAFSFIISYVFVSLFVYKKSKSMLYDVFSYFFALSNVMLISMIIEIAEYGTFM